jgi:hypothetical protein
MNPGASRYAGLASRRTSPARRTLMAPTVSACAVCRGRQRCRPRYRTAVGKPRRTGTCRIRARAQRPARHAQTSADLVVDVIARAGPDGDHVNLPGEGEVAEVAGGLEQVGQSAGIEAQDEVRPLLLSAHAVRLVRLTGPGRSGFRCRPPCACQRERTAGSPDRGDGVCEEVPVPHRHAGQARLGILVLLVGQPQGVQPGDDVLVLLPLRAPGRRRGDLRAVDRHEPAIHPVRQRVEFVLVLLAPQLQLQPRLQQKEVGELIGRVGGQPFGAVAVPGGSRREGTWRMLTGRGQAMCPGAEGADER